MTALIPKALQPGDTIGFVSPSARLNHTAPAVMARATQVLEKAGFQVRTFYNGQDDGTGSYRENRLAELREAFSTPSVRAIICTIGGTTFSELLPSLIADTELHAIIRADPKIVIGYSDITCLHWFLYSVVGLRTFYGPGAIPELGEVASSEDEDAPVAFCTKTLLQAVASSTLPIGKVPRSVLYAPDLSPLAADPSSTEPQRLTPTPPWMWLRKGKGQGRLFGGCLTKVVTLTGIRALAPTDWKGRIVFLESATGDDDVGALPERLRAVFADLRAQGVFDGVAGLVLGRTYAYAEGERRELLHNIIKDVLCHGSLDEFPILEGVDFGHTTPMVTLPYDAMAVLDSEQDLFEITEPGVRAADQ